MLLPILAGAAITTYNYKNIYLLGGVAMFKKMIGLLLAVSLLALASCVVRPGRPHEPGPRPGPHVGPGPGPHHIDPPPPPPR